MFSLLYAQALTKKHGKSIPAAKAKDLDPANWAYDSYTMSWKMVYKDVQPNKKLSAVYAKKARLAAEKQIVLAGYRLANLLEQML